MFYKSQRNKIATKSNNNRLLTHWKASTFATGVASSFYDGYIGRFLVGRWLVVCYSLAVRLPFVCCSFVIRLLFACHSFVVRLSLVCLLFVVCVLPHLAFFEPHHCCL